MLLGVGESLRTESGEEHGYETISQSASSGSRKFQRSLKEIILKSLTSEAHLREQGRKHTLLTIYRGFQLTSGCAIYSWKSYDSCSVS